MRHGKIYNINCLYCSRAKHGCANPQACDYIKKSDKLNEKESNLNRINR